jgi:hypothetical protein
MSNHLTAWQWWFGYAEDVDEDGIYAIDHQTRDDAIAEGLRETDFGQRFYIIEARSRQDIVDDDEVVPFGEKRNKACFINRGDRAEEVGA